MSLNNMALVDLVTAKEYLKVNAAADLQIFAEGVGTGDGSNVTFSLDNTPIGGSLKLYVNDVLQVEGSSDDYTISGADITFVTAPTNGYLITASYAKTASSNTFEAYEDGELETLIEAATKIAEDYSNVVFVQGSITETHEGDGGNILRPFKRPISSITSIVKEISQSLSDGDGSTTDWTLAETVTSGSAKVYVDAVLQTIADDYTISGSTLTFVSAPASDEKITITYTHTILAISEYSTQLAKGKIIGAWASKTIYKIVYVAGYAATRAATQVLLPDAVTAVLLILADLFENRGDTVDSINISGIGSTSYKLPSRAERILFRLKPLGGFS